jgi:membrane protease YdiL (CAAX protease family)
MNRGWKGVAAFFGAWIVLTALLFPAVRVAVEAVVPGMFTSARIFGRVQLGVALGLVPLLLWFWKDGPKRFFAAGNPMAAGGGVLGWGGLGVGMVAVAAWMQSLLGVRDWSGTPGMDVWAGALASGLLVAALEEFFFRGVLGLAFWKAAGGRPAAVLLAVNAAVFAAVHFIRPNADLPEGVLAGLVGWSNLQLWAEPADPWKLAGLLVAGLILARITWQRASLWAAIGLHAGWVAGLRICDGFWPEKAQAAAGWWGPSLEAGPIPVVLLLLVVFTLWGRPIRAGLD